MLSFGGKDQLPDLFDYCLTCSKNLCPDCMEKGCCGKVPAESGEEHDFSDEPARPAGGGEERP